MANTLQRANDARLQQEEQGQPRSINALLNSYLDGDKLRNRFNELLGKRAPQFISSLVSMINADAELKLCFFENPMSVIQAALKAATLDLPIEPSLGFAYIVSFKNNKKDANGEWRKVREATFIPGYKGLEQLCMRTGAYARVPDAVDVREGELVSYDRLTGDCEFAWVEDEDEREKLPIIGYAGYFRLKNGAEKTIYMTRKQIEQHERKHRKGDKQGKGWREDWESMARKTVIRRLISKYGLMSITYQGGDAETVALAEQVMDPDSDGPDNLLPEGEVITIDGDALATDPETGEVLDGQTTIE
ncbi:MAG: recombinase RecT [Oscillospiraceae bacterium]|nr:recombinase RecT [Oscillospiraceae bacterium]